MKIEFQVGDFSITQYGTTSEAQVKVDDAVGFALQEDGTYSMVGDFYHSTSKDLKKYYNQSVQFQQDLETAYAIEETFQKMEELQFMCTDNVDAEIGTDGKISMVFER